VSDSIRGSALCQLGRSADALPFLQRADEAAPDPLVDYDLGYALRDLHRDAEAVEPLRRAVASGRFGWRAHFHLGGALRVTDAMDEAMREFQAARASPDYQGFFADLRLAEVLIDLGRPQEALGALQDAIQRPGGAGASDPQVMGTLAEALALTGQPEAALEWAEGSLRGKPDWFRAHLARIDALRQLGRLDEARASVEAARRAGVKGCAHLDALVRQLER
jgi:tetratricopeptide (TPR) repeat protein